MIHPKIRAAVLAALQEKITEPVVWFDGRPGFLDADQLPAVAVYLTEAKPSDQYVDGRCWSSTLHVEVFLKADETDTALDHWMEGRIIPILDDIPALSELIEEEETLGYDYQRDDTAMTWGSADFQKRLIYYK
jgi:hypothetical protein